MIFYPVYPSSFLPLSHPPSFTSSLLDLVNLSLIFTFSCFFIYLRYFLKGLRFLPISHCHHEVFIAFLFFICSSPPSLSSPLHPILFSSFLSFSSVDNLRPKASWWSCNETFSFSQEFSFTVKNIDLGFPGFSSCFRSWVNPGWI